MKEAQVISIINCYGKLRNCRVTGTKVCAFAICEAERGRAAGMAHRRARMHGLGSDQGARARAVAAVGLEGRAA